MKLDITDDSGFMAIVNAEKYNTFVNEDWELPELFARFLEEMNKENLIIWATGMEGWWTVAILDKATNKKAFREFDKSIVVTNGRLYLTNYENLTMAAQYAYEQIPAKHNSDLFIPLDNGRYIFTVRQMFDPEDYDYDPEGKVDFEIVIKLGNEPTGKIENVFWWNEEA
ncbi:MAG: hypothetical protein LBU73_01385 [Helicobacteraceae bacterium]|nr:hypothetical protein [Helicobacteraceae bacterium]